VLPWLLERRSGRPVRHPDDGEVIRAGQVYVAPPDRYMLVDGPLIRLSHGPKEHHTRPAVDPLFRPPRRAAAAT
jgi:two-component system chemotaxis response regulator CheB